MSLLDTIRDAARQFKRLPKWQQRELRYVMCGNECRECDGFGTARIYEPSSQGGPNWITVACSCKCHIERVMCRRKA
jgi:hypothetical protein